MDHLKDLPTRPVRLSKLRAQWGLSRQATWARLNNARTKNLVVRHGRGIYAPGTLAQPKLPKSAQKVVRALQEVRAYRWAVSGLDLLLGELHYLPAHYPHLLLVEPAGEDAVRRALGAAGFVVASPRSIADLWTANPTQPVVVVQPVANLRGVPTDTRVAVPERAFLDLLVEIRRGFPFPGRDLQNVWRQLPVDTRDAIFRLGKQLHRQPFYGQPGTAADITDLQVDVE